MTALARLRQMDRAEIGYRLKEHLRQRAQRALRHVPFTGSPETRLLARLPCPAGGPGPVRAFLEDAATSRFYPSIGQAPRAELPALFERWWPGRLARIAEAADALRAHRVEILGHGEIALGADIDWHRDPVDGHRWDRRFFTDYDLVREGRDPKPVHELNRHQHLPRLAMAFYLLGDERCARETVSQLLGWIHQNPPGMGIHWHSSLEIALRSVSWMWALLLILPSPALDEAASRRIAASLVAQLDHVRAYPSLYGSPNTHLLAEATALSLAGLCLGRLAGASRWLEAGTRILSAELHRQVGHDGFHRELSTAYHCYALHGYLQVLALAERCRHPLPRGMWRRAERMLEALVAMVRPDGTIPRLGDDDGGRSLALLDTDYRSSASLLQLGAMLFERPDLLGLAGERQEEAMWLLGPSAMRTWDGTAGTFPWAHVSSLPEAGYVVHRSGRGASDAHLVFDVGGLGMAGGGHGHADALSVTLFAGGRELLVDPGTYAYVGSAWRDAFRSTAAHNTITVDGRSQSEPGGTFRWRRKASARLLADVSHDGIAYAAAEHDGYADLGVVHRRRLLHVRPDYWLVLDEIGGVGEHVLCLAYHLDADADVTELGSSGTGERSLGISVGSSSLSMCLLSSAPLEVTTSRASDAPLGWVSSRYGEKRPAPVVVARARARLPVSFVTMLAPHAAGSSPPRATAAPVRALARGAAPPLALRIEDPRGQLDVVAFAPGGPAVEIGAVDGVAARRAAGEVIWMRVSDGRLVRLLALDAAGRLCPPAPDVGHGSIGHEREEVAHVRHRRSP